MRQGYEKYDKYVAVGAWVIYIIAIFAISIFG